MLSREMLVELSHIRRPLSVRRRRKPGVDYLRDRRGREDLRPTSIRRATRPVPQVVAHGTSASARCTTKALKTREALIEFEMVEGREGKPRAVRAVEFVWGPGS